MNTGALNDRSGEDVELNSCSACAAGSCYAFVDGYCTALEPGAVHGSSEGCSFYKELFQNNLYIFSDYIIPFFIRSQVLYV